MQTCFYDVAVVGGGPAGLAAAAAAQKAGARALIIEREQCLGGILRQCIHAGFGLSYFAQELTGPEYADRFIRAAREAGVEARLDATVLEVRPGEGVLYTCAGQGLAFVRAKSVVLAMGCRERTRGNLRIPGTRPAGVYTAGTAQRLINRQARMVGRKVVILGSGDIGMIMARRLTLEGAQVVAVVEIMDYIAGLTRNRVQCLEDFGIPCLLSHTVTRVVGNARVEGVWIAQVDSARRPIPQTERFLDCDTLLLSVGLIPENELSGKAGIALDEATRGPVINQMYQTSHPAVFACGNVLHVNDLADQVSVEGAAAGEAAARYALLRAPLPAGRARCIAGKNVRGLCPQHLDLPGTGKVSLSYRVGAPGRDVTVRATQDGKQIYLKRVKRVSPGEMGHVTLECDQLGTGDIVLDVLKEGEA